MNNQKKIFLFSLLLVVSNSFLKAQIVHSTKMLDTLLDDPNKEWCYLQKSTTVIGFPYMSDVVQITFDGAIYTKSAELSFYYGKPLKPVFARQKKWMNGYIPVIQYNWVDENFNYSMEIFSAQLEGESVNNTLQFAKVKITNTGKKTCPYFFSSATKISGEDYRLGGIALFPETSYEINDNKVIRNDSLIYIFPAGANTEAIYGKTYKSKFKSKDFSIIRKTPTCIAHFTKDLEPGKSEELIFKIPRIPVSTSSKQIIEKIKNADYNTCLNNTISFWKKYIDNGHTIEIPEPRVNNALKASLVHMALATRNHDGKFIMTDGLPYPQLFITGFVQHQQAYDFFGHPEYVKNSLPLIYAQQGNDGLICDESLLQGKKLGVAQGHALQLLCHHYFITRDKNFAEEIYPKIKKGIEWLKTAITTDEYKLMPPAWPYDNEMILGHYTSNNLWAIIGLRSAIRLAKELDKKEDVKAWTEFHEVFKQSLLKALDITFKNKGYISPGLYDYLTGQKSREGFDEWQTNQEWENMLLLSPTEIVDADNPMVDATLSKIRKDRYREGVMSYRIFLHQYITANMIEQEMARNNQKQALIDFYNVLLHLGPTYEGFENLVEPWATRSVRADCPTPHAWASSKLAILIRNMMVCERGGEGGLNEQERNIHLFSLISPEWNKNGNEIKIQNACTEFGDLSATLKFSNTGATVNIENKFHHTPANIIVHIPYFVKLKSFKTDAKTSKLEKELLILSSDVKNISFEWDTDHSKMKGDFQELLKQYRGESTLRIEDKKEKIDSGTSFISESEKTMNYTQPLSFELTRKAFVHDYNRRAKEFVKNGGKLEETHAQQLIEDFK